MPNADAAIQEAPQSSAQKPADVYNGLLVSADSHVMESVTLWQERLPADQRDRAPRFAKPEAVHGRPGGNDPRARLDEMAVDGVSAEVLYPSLGLQLYALEDVELQESCFRVYNDWVSEYCSIAPQKLVGVASLSAYRIDQAVAELERATRLGLRGGMIWQTPPPELPFYSRHYDPLWAAAQSLGTSMSLHIVTGFDWSHALRDETQTGKAWTPEEKEKVGLYALRYLNAKVFTAMNALHDIIFSGVFNRFPRLKLVLVENNIGWLPFMLSQWDNKVQRKSKDAGKELRKLPSEYFRDHCFATFIEDPVGGQNLSWWGSDNTMWSNDYPHNASSWPDSRKTVKADLGHLNSQTLEKVLWKNACDLYGLAKPAAVPPSPTR